MTLRLNGSSSGFTEIDAPAAAGSNTITLPTSNGSAEQFLKNSGTAGELEFSSMVETSTGIGIGTTSPSQQLHISGGSPRILLTETTDNANAFIDAATSGVLEFSADDNNVASSSSIRFKVDGSERMRLRNDGTLRVSTNTSDSEIFATSSKTHNIHNDDGGNVALYLEHSHDSTPFGMVIDFTDAAPDNNSSYFITCQDSSTQRLRVWSDGDLDNHDNSYGSISDVKLKQDIVDAGSQWEDLKDLRVRKFKFKSDVAAYGDEAKTLIGLVAQEAETVSPGLVKNSPDLDEDGNDLGTVTKSIRYSVLYMKAVKALQEAQTRIETLETKVAALEAAE
tara:strand:+ start:1207 stop:2217 length:1011 start_codon:yes stop_codon:yes gene_type:complete